MSNIFNLTEIEIGKSYVISGYTDYPTDYSDKLFKMGFVIGTQIELAPVKIKDPIVLHIRGSRIALRKHEARQVLVKRITKCII